MKFLRLSPARSLSLALAISATSPAQDNSSLFRTSIPSHIDINSSGISLRRKRNAFVQNWKPAGKISKAELDKIVAGIRGQADLGDHTYCLFDTSDNCYLRNSKIKLDMAESGIDLSEASATIMIVETDPPTPPPKTWGYHTAAVFNTSQGVFVFDPDNKSPDEVYDGNLLTPLEDWLKVKWSFRRPVTFMAPPSVVLPGDVPNPPRYNPNREAQQIYWDRYQNKMPDDAIFDPVRDRKITPALVNTLKDWVPDLPKSSAEKFNELKKNRTANAHASPTPSSRALPSPPAPNAPSPTPAPAPERATPPSSNPPPPPPSVVPEKPAPAEAPPAGANNAS